MDTLTDTDSSLKLSCCYRSQAPCTWLFSKVLRKNQLGDFVFTTSQSVLAAVQGNFHASWGGKIPSAVRAAMIELFGLSAERIDNIEQNPKATAAGYALSKISEKGFGGGINRYGKEFLSKMSQGLLQAGIGLESVRAIMAGLSLSIRARAHAHWAQGRDTIRPYTLIIPISAEQQNDGHPPLMELSARIMADLNRPLTPKSQAERIVFAARKFNPHDRIPITEAINTDRTSGPHGEYSQHPKGREWFMDLIREAAATLRFSIRISAHERDSVLVQSPDRSSSIPVNQGVFLAMQLLLSFKGRMASDLEPKQVVNTLPETAMGAETWGDLYPPLSAWYTPIVTDIEPSSGD